MKQTAYAGKHPNGGSYRSFNVDSIHYDGPPTVDGKVVSNKREKPSKAAGKNLKGGNHRSYYTDEANASDTEENTEHGKRTLKGWYAAAKTVMPAKSYNHPVSDGIKRGKSTLIYGQVEVMDSGEGFTQVPLYATRIRYTGNIGDINHIGVDLSRKYGPLVIEYGQPAMKRLLRIGNPQMAQAAANDEKYTLDDLVRKAA